MKMENAQVVLESLSCEFELFTIQQNARLLNDKPTDGFKCNGKEVMGSNRLAM